MINEIRYGKLNSYVYGAIIDRFSKNKINSIRTSSIPLVQFWENTETRLNELLDNLGLTSRNPILCFEYPTSSTARGKSSMTDLMIVDGDIKIAIEAKFTEYLKNKIRIKTIQRWKNEKNNIVNREKVLNHWTKMINPFSKGLNGPNVERIDYQFYHRTASACNESEKAIVVYQLFYEKEAESDLNKYIEKLKEYVELINPSSNLNFYVWEIETCLIANNDSFKKNSNHFVEMKSRNIYEFGMTKFIKL